MLRLLSGFLFCFVFRDIGTGTKLVLTDLHGPEASDMPEWNPVRDTIMVWVKNVWLSLLDVCEMTGSREL